MSRLLLSPDADSDVDGIEAYVQALPQRPAERIRAQIAEALTSIAEHPLRSPIHSLATRFLKQEVRVLVSSPYLFFYRFSGPIPEVLAVLHGAQDRTQIFQERLT